MAELSHPAKIKAGMNIKVIPAFLLLLLKYVNRLVSGSGRENSVCSTKKNGMPGGSRTHDLLLRRQTLYPTELRAQHLQDYIKYCLNRKKANDFASKINFLPIRIK